MSNQIDIVDKVRGYDLILTIVMGSLSLFILSRPSQAWTIPIFILFLSVTLHMLNRAFSLLRVRVSLDKRIIYRSNFSFFERIKDKILKHPSEIKFDDIDEIYVDDNGTSKADFKKYHVFIRTNDTYCLAIATFSSRKDAEKLLNEIRKVINE